MKIIKTQIFYIDSLRSTSISTILKLVLTAFVSVYTTVGSNHIFAEDETIFPRIERSSEKVIRVGVRSDTVPFSYRKPTKNEEDMLIGYGGYIVEVCRSVLRQVVGVGAFRKYHVKAVPVESDNRFGKLLVEDVDMLCGPDSITTSRLKRYNVSHPVFLSGIAVVRWPDDQLPRTTYCGPILGVVKGTTSQIAGVSAALDAKAFDLRFDFPVRKYLEQSESQYSDLKVDTLSDAMNNFAVNIFDAERVAYDVNGVDAISPASSITTDECPNGYVAGPVVIYQNHDDGLADLCDKKIFFYLGDVDIVKKKIPMDCEAVVSRRTYTKEAYGIYFRKPLATLDGHDDPLDMQDAVLYTEFNNALLTQMQDSQNLLMNQYFAEFGESRMASDLESFFQSFQFAENY